LEVQTVPSSEKKEKVKKIKKWFEKTDSLLVLHYKGLKVSEATELRTQVKGLNAELRVIKNTLTRLALAGTPKEELVSLLDGPVAVVFVDEDSVPVARAIRDFARGRSEFYLLGGMIEGRILNGAQVESVAVLPPREVLLARMVGAIQAPLSGMLSLVTAPLRKTLGLFKALADVAPAPADAPEAPEAEANQAAERQQADADQDELNADVEATEASSADKPAEPEAQPQADADKDELNTDTKAEETESADKPADAPEAPQAEANQAAERQQADADHDELKAEAEATKATADNELQENKED
jgi:large subunit ribosomal protein L10